MWDFYGLQQNPFEIKAVEQYGMIPTSTFIGRDENRHAISQVIKTRWRSLSLVVGEKGIGKTSLGNMVRADLSDIYFITLSEIDTQSDWSSSDFILHALASIYEATTLARNYLGLPDKYIDVCNAIHSELQPLFEDQTSGFGVQAVGFGLEKTGGRGLSRTATTFLKTKFKAAVASICRGGYKGVLLQFNNLDNIEEEKKLSGVLADLRDFLLTDNCHFIFLGNKTMEACFKTNNKVNECISLDIQLGPLTLAEIKKILERRYTAFKLPNREPISPVLDDALEVIHKLHDGNIRQIFYSLDHASINAERILRMKLRLDASALSKVLFTLAKERIKSEIQPKAFKVLDYALNAKRPITNTEVTRRLKIKPQNTSKYLAQLKQNNLLISLSKEGRNVFYKPVNEAKWLLLSPEKGKQLYLEA